MCWMMLPILAPWFKMNQDLRSLMLDLRFQPLCWRIFRSSNPRPGWSQTQRVEPESFTSMPPNPLLDWRRLPLLNHLRSAEYWWSDSSKNPQTQTRIGGQNPNGFIQERTCHKLQLEPDSSITASNLITFNRSQTTSKVIVCSWCVVKCWRWRWWVLDTFFTLSCFLEHLNSNWQMLVNKSVLTSIYSNWQTNQN